MDIDELAALIFEDLQLPFLEEKAKKAVPAKTTRFNEIRRTGVMSNLDKRRMILENIKRNARETSERALRPRPQGRPPLQDLGGGQPLRVERRRASR